MLFQQNVDSNGNRVYGIFLYVVMNDNELQERTWTRDIRYLQFVILNSEGRQLKDKTTVALYRENQLSWGFPGLLDNSILMRDPVVSSRRTVDIVCRLRYHPDQERMRRPISPSIPGSLLGSSMMGSGNLATRAASAPASYWDQKAGGPTAMVDSVGKNLRKLLNSPDFSDLEIIVGPERRVMHGHKAILAARSDWFRSALRPGFREAREGRIVLSEDDPKIFEALLEFLYTGEYPLATVSFNRKTSLVHDPIHFSPRSPPVLPPRGMDETTASIGGAFDSQRPADANAAYDYLKDYDTEMDCDDDRDEHKYMLFMMADKYGVSELKNMLRLHLSNELLDLSNTAPPGQRLLRLIRFAFEELPEATTPLIKRESNAGLTPAGSIVGKIDTPPSTPGFTHGYVFGSGYPQANDLENREGTASAFGHTAVPGAANGVGVVMQSNQRSTGRLSASSGRNEHDGIYGRDNETALLRESITAYVAKMFHIVRQVEGFDELLREGGEMGGFVKMVMDYMYRP